MLFIIVTIAIVLIITLTNKQNTASSQIWLVVTHGNNFIVSVSSDCKYGEIPKIIVSEGIPLYNKHTIVYSWV